MTSILANFVSPDKDDESEDHLHLRQHVPLTRVLSREKEACEFYKERKAMEEGHLSALVKSSSMSSPTARTSTTPASTSVEQKAALVTPTKNRPITPHRGKQSQKKSALSFNRGRKKEKKTTEPLKKDIFGKVTVSTPRLSPDSKRKHRVFWTQLDLNDVEDEDEDDTTGKNNALRSNVTDLPDDEVTDQHAMKARSMIAPSTEVQENDHEPNGAFDGMLNAINTCLDCGWLGSAIEAGNNNNTHLDRMQPTNFQNRALIMDSEDNGSLVTDRNSASQVNNSYGRDFRGSNGFENTAIEVEFTDEDDAPDEEDDDEEQKARSPFVQLNPNGNITAFTPKPSSDVGANEGQAFSYDLTRSHTWGEKEKNAYLQAMAKKAKDDFKRRKGLVEDEAVTDYNADIDDRNSYENKTPLKSALSRSKSADGMSPAKSVGFSPATIAEFPLRNDVRDEYDGDEPPVVKRLGQTEGEFSDTHTNQAIDLKPSGSILSVGRRKKKGNFQQLDDDEEEDEEMQNEHSVSLKSDPKPRSLPHGDVFEFEDRHESNPPLSSLKLDPYHDSSDVSVLGSVMVGGDGASVVSGKSHYTTGTNATNWSTSTRRRHRGAAKNRKVDLSDTQRPAGWLESIKAAAASNNRKWDPKHGWVDYIDEEELEIQKIGKLKPPLNNRKNKSTDDSDDTGDHRDKITIPFPSEWERERDEMVSLASQDTDLKGDTADDYQNNIGTLRPVVQDAIPEGSDEESDDTDDRSSRKESSPIQRLKKNVPEKHVVSSDASQDSHNVFTNESDEFHASGSQNLAQPSVFDWIGRCQSSDIVKDAATGGGDVIKEAIPKFRGVIGQAFSSKENEPNIIPINENKQELNDDDDFEGHRSFDFDTSGEDTHLSNGDGFKVIESSLNTNIDRKERASTPSLEKGQEFLNRLKSLKRPTENEGDRSVTSVTSSVAAKATDWRKKVELKNQNDPTKDQSTQATSTLFVSSADDSSTFEVMKKKELNDDDSIFKFEKRVAPKMYVRKDAEEAAPSFVLPTKSKISDVNDSMSEVTTSTAPSFVPRPKKETFISRLQACTGPIFDDNNEMPQSHLDFLKNSASCGSSPLGKDRKRPAFSNVPFCGNPENVHEDSPVKVAESRMKSSVAASYLQAIREKSKGTSFIPKGSEVRKTPSDISLGSQKSETWNRFLEKRNQALASSTKRSGSVASSEDATSFAQKKVQEILNKVSKDSSQDNLAKYPRSSSAIPLRPPSSGGIPRSLSTGRQRAFESGALLNRSDAARAAEDLAAAKVEAMILSQKNINDDGEI